jgi:D-serine dehydratase
LELELNRNHVDDAELHLRRFAGLLMQLYPELAMAGGIIESPLHKAEALQRECGAGLSPAGQWWIKCDHALPVAGSIKARGGIYEVLLHAEELALRAQVIGPHQERRALASAAARDLFARHQVVVGSTGNLGLSIGIMAAALGFRATVHMSADAKAWKKQRLRARGVEVVEHEGDFAAAVAAGREQAKAAPNAYFVDDEHSLRLFLGYSVAAPRLVRQLAEHAIKVDDEHPLFVYLPCGVGGAPGGITFGLRAVFADHVHCFFAEPVAAPCMLIRLSSLRDAPVLVSEVGLDGRTEADGLAVGRASELAARLIRPLISGGFTVPDDDLFEHVHMLRCEGLQIEPSAAAGFRGPRWLLESEQGRQYLEAHGLTHKMRAATHILWTTGGALVPEEEHRKFEERGRAIHAARSMPPLRS